MTTSRAEPGSPSVLVADDDSITRRAIASSLSRAGYSIVTAENGARALQLLSERGAPRLAILDWVMPGLDGVEVCRRLRREEYGPYTYIVLLTSRDGRTDLIAGLEAGADDYLKKPFDPAELRSRVRSGERILRLQENLERHVAELEGALAHVKRLQGLLPLCMYCKAVRDDANTWHRIEEYLEEQGGLLVTHSLCADCLRKHYPEFASDRVGEADPGEDRS